LARCPRQNCGAILSVRCDHQKAVENLKIFFGKDLALQGKRIGVVVSGGNVDLAHFATLVQTAA
jgi:hypothetical protein